jgi:hypothetical protein
MATESADQMSDGQTVAEMDGWRESSPVAENALRTLIKDEEALKQSRSTELRLDVRRLGISSFHGYF